MKINMAVLHLITPPPKATLHFCTNFYLFINNVSSTYIIPATPLSISRSWRTTGGSRSHCFKHVSLLAANFPNQCDNQYENTKQFWDSMSPPFRLCETMWDNMAVECVWGIVLHTHCFGVGDKTFLGFVVIIDTRYNSNIFYLNPSNENLYKTSLHWQWSSGWELTFGNSRCFRQNLYFLFAITLC